MKWFSLRPAILFFSLFSFTAFALVEELPPIDAHQFEIKPLQKSKSGKIYRFESQRILPKTGNLILTYSGGKPVMAFRVLKNDAEKSEFVAKRIRRYDQMGELNLQESYTSIEKIADAILPPPTDSAQLETKPELPSASESESKSPPPLAEEAQPLPTPEQEKTAEAPKETPETSVETTKTDEPAPENLDQNSNLDELDELAETEEEEELPEESIEVEETIRMDPFRNILSVQGGYFGNASNFSGNAILSNGFSVAFAHKLFQDIFIRKRGPQDSLSLEIGGIYYRIVNRDGGNDLYSMLPFYGNLLYQLNLSPSFALNLYSGLQYNYMTSATNPGRSLSVLQGAQLNAGIGAFFTIGPQWLLRADVGWDRIAGGLSVKW